jgi:outer membrane protein TolC
MSRSGTSNDGHDFSRIGAAVLVSAAIAAIADLPAHAQSRPPTLSIDEVLSMTLASSPDVRIARAALDGTNGAMVQAARPFDLRPSASVSNSRTVRSAGTDVIEDGGSYADFTSRTDVGLSKLFRSGVHVASDVSIARTSPVRVGGPTLNQFAAIASVTVPLSRGRHGGFASAIERAATEDYRSAAFAVRASTATAVFRAANAYWKYVAAHRGAEIQRTAAARARQVVEELLVLVRADERPRSDLDLLVANAASKHAAEVRSEFQIVQTRAALALAIGLDADSASALPRPGSDFPAPDTAAELPVPIMVADAVAGHDELAAAQRQREGARLLRDAAARELQPRIDLVFSGGYTGRVGGGSLRQLLEPLFTNILGPNASVQVSVEPSATNSTVRAALMSADAAYVQTSVTVERLAHTIAIDVGQAAAAVTSSRVASTTTHEAVEHSRLALATVQRNFELGTATVFDRILAEDTVTNAELAHLAAIEQYAQAVLSLQLARGVLVSVSGGDVVVDPRRVLRPSREDGR